MPLAVACALEVLLRDAVEMHGMERFAFLRAQEERSRRERMRVGTSGIVAFKIMPRAKSGLGS